MRSTVFAKVVKRYKIIALGKDVAQKLIQELEKLPRAEHQAHFEEFLQRGGYKGDDVLDLLYDLNAAGWQNLKKPQQAPSASPTPAPTGGSWVSNITTLLKHRPLFVDPASVRLVQDVTQLVKTDTKEYTIWLFQPAKDLDLYQEKRDNFSFMLAGYDSVHGDERQKIHMHAGDWLLAVSHEPGETPDAHKVAQALDAHFATLP